MRVTKDQTYIGDGVYVSNDGYHWVLKTESSYGEVKIFLDSHTRKTLYELLKSEFEELANE